MIRIKPTCFQLFLRIALASTMLSAVADRFGVWKTNIAWGNWKSFEAYTSELTFFLPEWTGISAAYLATFLEIILSIFLIIGFKTKITTYGTAILLLLFAISMTISLGLKTSLDYSVWTSAAAAFLLSAQEKK